MPIEGDWWHGFECHKCKTVFDVRVEGEVVQLGRCPRCAEMCELRGRWMADDGGFGSRADKSLIFATPQELARQFHESYERLAPHFDYETRKESAVAWDKVPDKNKQLMFAVAAELINIFRIRR
jgi:hypothetical protein